MRKKALSFLLLLVQLIHSHPIDSLKIGGLNLWRTERFLLNTAPILNATGNQVYCPLNSIRIVTDFSITDPDDSQIDAIYIQISSGYNTGEEQLSLSGFHPNISSTWDALAGKLTLSGVTGQTDITEMVNAVKDVVFFNTSANPSGIRTFSITIGQANYLPSNGHYYQYIPNVGITWSAAKIAAENSNYYGLQGYLATITAADEAQLSGEQASGAGWIGGSDSEVEGVWKWMTGPENGTVFWNNGPSLFSKWNSGEPNNLNEEDYAHITAPGVGILGSWNDLSNTGATSGDYQPKGYIVEYGGMPGDPILNISASTILIMPNVENVNPIEICESESTVINVTSTGNTINWYENQSGGIPVATGNTFSTPNLTTNTSYFADASPAGCTTFQRSEVKIIVHQKPTLTIDTTVEACENSSTELIAQTTSGIIKWYETISDSVPVATGSSFNTPILSNSVDYFVEADNNGCLSVPRVSVEVTVNPSPGEFDDEEIIICEGSTTQLIPSISEMNYTWSTGENTPQISVSESGEYSVQITNVFNCSSNQLFTVIVNASPEISGVSLIQNKAIIETNQGDFEFSLDGVNFQPLNTFILNKGGQYTVHVREKNGCGYDTFLFVYLAYPAFFTPNNDGYYDSWTVEGLEFFPLATVNIYNRYGKLVAVLNTQNWRWDGISNGAVLPSDDYWFVAKIDPTQPDQTGHFSMKR